MKKIIYLKQEVKLGEVITYQGLEVEVTQTLIDNNPDTFKVIDERQELLDKARRDYPAGTVFRSLFGKICTVKNKPRYSLGAYSIILIDGIYVIYRDGRWAEILPLKFTTEDGVDIYGDMKTYLVQPNDNDITSCHIGLWDGNSAYNGYKYFYHKENALAYIEKHKEKTLEDYENMLLRTDIDSANAREVCWFYHILKKKEPKLYYTKILQLIADDLNDGWVVNHKDTFQKKYFMDDNSEYIKSHMTVNYGLVYFKSEGLVKKARNILGDKVKYLFN